MRLGDPLTARSDEWALVVDDDQHPLGWAHRDDAVAGTSGGQGTPRPENLRLGGTLAQADGPLRAMLDAALSSPSGRGVLVDPDGRLVGTVRASEVLAVIEAQEIPGR